MPRLGALNVAKAADAAIAGGGLAASVGLMGLLEPLLGLPLLATPMLASGIIFFYPQQPPSPQEVASH